MRNPNSPPFTGSVLDIRTLAYYASLLALTFLATSFSITSGARWRLIISAYHDSQGCNFDYLRVMPQ